MLGISRTSTDWDAVTAADVNRIVRSGRRRFFSAANWKFLKDDLTIPVDAPLTTGTVTIVAGVVTLAGSTFPATSATNYLFESGGGVYGIASYDSTTQITLDDTSVATGALTTYSLHKNVYDLPAAFGGWEGPITVENHRGVTLNESRNFPEYVVRAFANRLTAREGRPEIFSVVSTPDAETAIATHRLKLYPLADKAYVLRTRYKINAGDTLDAAITAISADPVFTECYKESVLAAAEVIAFGQPSSHTARYQELLSEAIRQDNAMAGIRYGRPRSGVQGRSRYHELIVGEVNMEGQRI